MFTQYFRYVWHKLPQQPYEGGTIITTLHAKKWAQEEEVMCPISHT